MAQPGLGIPLGGLGAGSFMINQAGTFGPWNMGGSTNSNYEKRILPQAAIHIREQQPGRAGVHQQAALAVVGDLRGSHCATGGARPPGS